MIRQGAGAFLYGQMKTKVLMKRNTMFMIVLISAATIAMSVPFYLALFGGY